MFWRKKADRILVTFKGDKTTEFKTEFSPGWLAQFKAMPERDQVFYVNVLEGLKQHAAMLGNFMTMTQSERDEHYEIQMGIKDASGKRQSH